MTTTSARDLTPIAAALSDPNSDQRPEDWREAAACRRADPELFFPIGSTGAAVAEIEQAKEVCARCPVRRPCLAYALATGQQYGIWGGCDEIERRPLHRRWRETHPTTGERPEWLDA